MARSRANPSAAGSPVPGADANVLLNHLKTHGAVRLFSSAIQGDLGGVREVEISSAGNADGESRSSIGLVVRDVGRRLSRLSGSEAP